MTITLIFDRLDKNRVFIDTQQHCSGGCLYCYAPDFEEKESLARTYFESGAETAQAVAGGPHFHTGIYGTAVSLGCYADPLHLTSYKSTLEVLPHLMALGNPIQMASKCFVGSAGMAHQIAAAQQYPGQFTLLVTITTFSHAAEFEPGAPTPQRRLEILDAFQQAGVNTALFIKPMLPGITEYEVEVFAAAMQKYSIPACVIGLFYANQRILDQFRRAGMPAQPQPVGAEGGHHFPNDAQQVLTQQSNDDLRDSFYQVLCQQTASTAIPIFKTSLCAVSHHLQIPDPMRTWRRYPDLCVGCQDCEKLVANLAPKIGERYNE